MKLLSIACLWVVMLGAALDSNARDLSMCPCDIIGGNFCFRLPAESSVTISVPADIIEYTITDKKGEIASIALDQVLPSDIINAFMMQAIEGKFGKGYFYHGIDGKRKGSLELRVLIVPAEPNLPHFDLVAHVSIKNKQKLFELFSGVRPCFRLEPDGNKCPIDRPFGLFLTSNLDKVVPKKGP